MKRRTLSFALLLALLFAGWACSAWAESAWTEFTFDEQAAKQAYPSLGTGVIPQTPEALLLVFKDLLANPDIDGKEFCEKRFGIDREKGWVESILPRGLKKEYLVTSLGSPPLPSVPFRFVETFINREDKLGGLSLLFFENLDFRITPALTRQIFGEPEEIWVNSPTSEVSGGEYKVTYRYSTKKYTIDFIFHKVALNKTQQFLSAHEPGRH
ncbi:MAG: hypothetical protein Q4G66_09445 [bacterium]|nr:hypothetical protein [bacterium]